jgi:vacuolar-type H+-ATPase subunit I/STV1
MKMSILMGVVHMTLGILMSHNHIYFRDHLSLMYEFIPQMIFLYSLGYLCFLIIFKWVAQGTSRRVRRRCQARAVGGLLTCSTS